MKTSLSLFLLLAAALPLSACGGAAEPKDALYEQLQALIDNRCDDYAAGHVLAERSSARASCVREQEQQHRPEGSLVSWFGPRAVAYPTQTLPVPGYPGLRFVDIAGDSRTCRFTLIEVDGHWLTTGRVDCTL